MKHNSFIFAVHKQLCLKLENHNLCHQLQEQKKNTSIRRMSNDAFPLPVPLVMTMAFEMMAETASSAPPLHAQGTMSP